MFAMQRRVLSGRLQDDGGQPLNRRGFFAGILGAIGASQLPTVKARPRPILTVSPTPHFVGQLSEAMRLQWRQAEIDFLSGTPLVLVGSKVGDAIHIRKPVRFLSTNGQKP